MTAGFTQKISSGNEVVQKGDSGPGRIDNHEAQFFSDLDALTFADYFSSMEAES